MRLFAKHYREAQLFMPERFAKREFGFMFFDRSFVIRHTGFQSRASLKKYLVENTPSHVYYSSAYYEKPSAPTMAEKKWLGADLIFDLDADHIKGSANLPFPDMLSAVKREVIRLLDDFILADFGFSPKEVRVVFSGGRGYHIHISHPSVLQLRSHERREIVDYITGTGLDIDWVFPKELFEVSKVGDRLHTRSKRRMAKLTDGGWLARTRRGIDDLFQKLEGMQQEERVNYLWRLCSESGIPYSRKSIEGLDSELFVPHGGRRGIDRMRQDDNFEVFSSDRYLNQFLEIIKRITAVEIAGETDEPVTSDVKRLIRLPSSIHGKTGFEVVSMQRDDLDDFDPFVDAVPEAFSDDEVNIHCKEESKLELKGKSYVLKEGDNSVPEYLAVHAICRRLASIKN